MQWEQNSLALLKKKLTHLEGVEREEQFRRLRQYSSDISSVPGRTHLIEHDIDVGEAVPVTVSPYRVSPMKQKLAKKDLGEYA